MCCVREREREREGERCEAWIIENFCGLKIRRDVYVL